MPRPCRARRILKWTGLIVCIGVAVVGVASAYGYAFYQSGPWAAAVDAGNFKLLFIPEEWGYSLPQGFTIAGKSPPSFSFTQTFYTRFYEENGPLELTIQFWLPVLLTAIPTAWLWYRDRRRILPGDCPRCGYNLTGNTSGVCSECGMIMPASAVHPGSVPRSEL